ncbi:MAG: beta-lactamase family protein [Acidimicrobiia bacterium]|nr:beta-lactamase family protein [Acidimicrobiia bacterium]
MSTIDELCAAAAVVVAEHPGTSCQLAVGSGGDVVAFETFGGATNDYRFSIFSATKPFVASVVWLLVADGRVDLSDPIDQYVPELGAAGLGAVTIEQVMLHTAGFPNAPMDTVEGGDAIRRRARFATWHSEWEPGTRFEYHAESAHWVLADLIDRVTGADYRDVLEARVCAPLGVPRILGIPVEDQADIVSMVPRSEAAAADPLRRLDEPLARLAGNPAGGGCMTAAHLARFYQGLLHNPGGVWDDAVLRDALTNIRCTFPDPLLGVAANRTVGLVLAGDDGHHQLRYAIFGRGCSPGSFGHAGAHAQVAWADPASGISFAFLTNAMHEDMMQSGMTSNRLATIAADLRF